MVNPVPGYGVTTAYRLPNSGYWNACGWHTGQDYAAPNGTGIVAARGGQVVHTSYGSAFGGKQFAIRPGDGTEDFYAHCSVRPASGITVATGQAIAQVGQEGNATGPHLHFERHNGYGWACGSMADPMTSHNAQDGQTSGWLFASGHPVYGKYLKWQGHLQNSDGISDSIRAWQDMLNHHSIPGGETLPITGQWFAMTADETRLCQRHHIPPEDPYPEGVYVGPAQFEHVKGATGCPYQWMG